MKMRSINHSTKSWEKCQSYLPLGKPFSRKTRSSRVTNKSGTVIAKYSATYEVLLPELPNIVELKREAIRDAGRNIVAI
jgi:hypothetical protein